MVTVGYSGNPIPVNGKLYIDVSSFPLRATGVQSCITPDGTILSDISVTVATSMVTFNFLAQNTGFSCGILVIPTRIQTTNMNLSVTLTDASDYVIETLPGVVTAPLVSEAPVFNMTYRDTTHSNITSLYSYVPTYFDVVIYNREWLAGDKIVAYLPMNLLPNSKGLCIDVPSMRYTITDDPDGRDAKLLTITAMTHVSAATTCSMLLTPQADQASEASTAPVDIYLSNYLTMTQTTVLPVIPAPQLQLQFFTSSRAPATSLYRYADAIFEISVQNRHLELGDTMTIDFPSGFMISSSYGTVSCANNVNISLAIVSEAGRQRVDFHAEDDIAQGTVCQVGFRALNRTDTSAIALTSSVTPRLSAYSYAPSVFTLPTIADAKLTFTHLGTYLPMTPMDFTITFTGRKTAVGDEMTLSLPYPVATTSSDAACRYINIITQFNVQLFNESITVDGQIQEKYYMKLSFARASSAAASVASCTMKLLAYNPSPYTSVSASLTTTYYPTEYPKPVPVLVSTTFPLIRGFIPTATCSFRYSAPRLYNTGALTVSIKEIRIARYTDVLVITPAFSMIANATAVCKHPDRTTIDADVVISTSTISLRFRENIDETITLSCDVPVTSTTFTTATSFAAALNNAAIATEGSLSILPLFTFSTTMGLVNAFDTISLSIYASPSRNTLAVNDIYVIDAAYPLYLEESNNLLSKCRDSTGTHVATVSPYTPPPTTRDNTPIPVVFGAYQYSFTVVADKTSVGSITCTFYASPKQPISYTRFAAVNYVNQDVFGGVISMVPLYGTGTFPKISLVHPSYTVSELFVTKQLRVSLRFVPTQTSFTLTLPIPIEVVGMTAESGYTCTAVPDGSVISIARVVAVSPSVYKFTVLYTSYSSQLDCYLQITPLGTLATPTNSSLLYNNKHTVLTAFPAITITPYYTSTVKTVSHTVADKLYIALVHGDYLLAGDQYTFTAPYAYESFNISCVGFSGDEIGYLSNINLDNNLLSLLFTTDVDIEDCVICNGLAVPSSVALGGNVTAKFNNDAIVDFNVTFPAVMSPYFYTVVNHKSFYVSSTLDIYIFNRNVHIDDMITFDYMFPTAYVINSYIPPSSSPSLASLGAFSACVTPDNVPIGIVTLVQNPPQISVRFTSDIDAGTSPIACGVPFYVRKHTSLNEPHNALVYSHYADTPITGLAPVSTVTFPSLTDATETVSASTYLLTNVNKLGYLYFDSVGKLYPPTYNCVETYSKDSGCTNIIIPLPNPLSLAMTSCFSMLYDSNLTPVGYVSGSSPETSIFPTSSLLLRLNNAAETYEVKCIMAVYSPTPLAAGFATSPITVDGTTTSSYAVQPEDIKSSYFLRITPDNVSIPGAHVKYTFVVSMLPALARASVTVDLSAMRFQDFLGCDPVTDPTFAVINAVYNHRTAQLSVPLDDYMRDTQFYCVFSNTMAALPSQALTAQIVHLDTDASDTVSVVHSVSFRSTAVVVNTEDAMMYTVTAVYGSYLTGAQLSTVRSSFAKLLDISTDDVIVASMSVQHVPGILVASTYSTNAHSTINTLKSSQRNPIKSMSHQRAAGTSGLRYYEDSGLLDTNDTSLFAHVESDIGLIPIPRNEDVLLRMAGVKTGHPYDTQHPVEQEESRDEVDAYLGDGTTRDAMRMGGMSTLSSVLSDPPLNTGMNMTLTLQIGYRGSVELPIDRQQLVTTLSSIIGVSSTSVTVSDAVPTQAASDCFDASVCSGACIGCQGGGSCTSSLDCLSGVCVFDSDWTSQAYCTSVNSTDRTRISIICMISIIIFTILAI
jgi:hypothetical protein